MRKTLILVVSAFMTVNMLASCENNNSEAEVNVTVENCDMHNIFDSVSSKGTIEQDTGTYTVSTDIESYCVKNVYVKVGDSVKVGDKICEFDTENIKQQISDIKKKISEGELLDEQSLNSKKSELEYLKNSQKIKLENLEKNISLAQKKYNDASDKYNKALENRNNTQKQYDEAKAGLDNAKTEEEIASCSSQCELYQNQLSMYAQECDTYYTLMSEYKNTLNSSQSEYDSIRIESNREIDRLQYEIDSYKSGNNEYTESLEKLNKVLKNSVIYSPSDGVVTSVNVEKGKTDVESNLATIVNDNSKVIHMEITDRDLLAITEGMDVEFYLLSDSSNVLNGTISKINYVKGENGFDVYATSDDIQDKSIGMNVSCNIVTIDKNVTSVSNSAVWQKEGDSDNYYVYVAEPSSEGLYVLNECKVDIGVKNGEYVEIVNSDFDEDAHIVNSDTSDLTDGMVVGITDTELNDE